jgi:hypothetical protein
MVGKRTLNRCWELFGGGWLVKELTMDALRPHGHERVGNPESGAEAAWSDVVSRPSTEQSGEEIAVESCRGWEDFSQDHDAMEGPVHQLAWSLDDRILRRYTTLRPVTLATKCFSE